MKGFKQGAQTGELGKAGEAMGFARGGQVKQNPESPQFRMKTEKTGNKSDHGNMPKTEGDSEQEKEAGGRSKVRPGYKEGGAVTDGYRKVMKGGRQCYMKGGRTYMMKGGKMHPYMAGGAVAGGAAAAAKGARRAVRSARNTVTPGNTDRGQGESVKASGRGKKHVSK